MSPSPSAPTPEVSVVMSCYNASRWLREAVHSVVAQTHRDFELILVDDGSTDETWSIIGQLSGQDDRIVAITKMNTGLADSLNHGIHQARGTWVARLDADDLSEPARLAAQLAFVREHPEVVLLGTGFASIDETGNVIKTHHYSRRHSVLLRNLEQNRRFFPHSSALFNRRAADTVGGYNPHFRKTQDWDLWFRLAERGSIACLDKVLVRVRRHSAQITNSVDGPSQLVYAIVAAVCHFLRVEGHDDPSASTTESEWEEFVAWVSERMAENGIFSRREARTESRNHLFATRNLLVGSVRAAVLLLRSGHAAALLKEGLIGMSLPQDLARKWIVVSR